MSAKRHVLSLKEKIGIVEVYNREKLSVRDLAKRFNIGKTQAAETIKNREELLKYMELGLEKRRRSSNFSTKEVNLLLSIIKKFSHTINNKNSDASTMAAKAQCWEKVEEIFNAGSGGYYRTHGILRNKYKNIKKYRKKQFQLSLDDGDLLSRVTERNQVIYPKEFSQEASSHEYPEIKIETDTLEDLDYGPIETDIENKINVESTDRSIYEEGENSLEGKDDDYNESTNSSYVANDYDPCEKFKMDFMKEEFSYKLRHMQEKHELELKLMNEAAIQKMNMEKAEHELGLELKRQAANQQLRIQQAEHELKLKLLQLQNPNI